MLNDQAQIKDAYLIGHEMGVALCAHNYLTFVIETQNCIRTMYGCVCVCMCMCMCMCMYVCMYVYMYVWTL